MEHVNLMPQWTYESSEARSGWKLDWVNQPWHILPHDSIMIDTGVYISCGQYLLRDKAFFVMVKKRGRGVVGRLMYSHIQPCAALYSLVQARTILQPRGKLWAYMIGWNL